MYGQSRKDVFLTLLSVCSNFATLKPVTAVVQQRRLRGLILYLPAAIIPLYIYNKVYTLQRCTLFAYICEGRSPWIHISVVPSFRHSGIDQAVVYVYILSAGVGRLHVAYPQVGAMRRPEVRDRHGETFSHVFFVSII